ncbi:hypothetical protein MASR2M78_12110 [Treponema sp.]
MTVRSVEIGADTEVLKLGFSDGSSFFIRSVYLDPSFDVSHLTEGAELDSDTFLELVQAGEAYNAEYRAMRLLALREHSRQALLLKLRKRDIDEQAAKKALDRLEDLGLLDDRRFAELWVQTRIGRKLEGPRILEAGLRLRGVSTETARAAVRRVLSEEDEIQRIVAYLGAGSATTSPSFETERQALLKAGFSSHTIRAAIEYLT